MKNPFGKKPVPQAVRDELTKRSTSAVLTWNAKKFPWMEITSLCSTCTGRYVTLSSLPGTFYESTTGTNAYQRPSPGVESIEIKKQGELGTTRKAIIKIKAFTDAQLIELQKCYFVPGMGIRVEWGWSINIDGNYNTRKPLSLDLSDARATCEIKQLEKNFPNYSGLQGIIANFSYSLTTDNYWDCSLEVIAAAEAVSGVKVNTYNCGCKRKNQVDDDKGNKTEVVRVESDMIAHLRDLQENYEAVKPSYSRSFRDYGQSKISRNRIKKIKQRSESGGDADTGLYGYLGSFFTGDYSTETYISWGTLESMINYLVMDTSKERIKKKFLGKLDSTDIRLPYHPAVQSADPKVFFIPGANYDNIAFYVEGDYPLPAIDSDGVVLSDIMVNVIFLIGELRSVEKNEGSLIGFLNSVLRKICDVSGNLWSLEAVSTTESCENPSSDDPPLITIIDVKKYEADTVFNIPSSPDNSIVRDMKLDMKLTDAMKTQAVYSGGPIAKTKSPSGGNCDGEVFKAFNADAGQAYNRARGKQEETVASSNCGTSNKGELQTTENASYNGIFERAKEKGPVGPQVTACISALVEAYNLSPAQFLIARNSFAPSPTTQQKRDHCKGVPLPFEFSFTIDGIGGFEFGQMVSSDRIPKAISDNFEWQVTSVEHSITVNDWTTTVNTVCRYKNN